MERYDTSFVNDNIRQPKILIRTHRTKEDSLDLPERQVESKKQRVPDAPIIEEHEGNSALDLNEPIVEMGNPIVKPKVLCTSWHTRQK